MKKASTIFLQAAVVLSGAGVLAFMLWLPPHEGRNASATLFAAYFDPFLAYVYIGSVPFFAALFQAFKVLGYVRRDEVFSPAALKALRLIRYCALATAGAAAGAVVYIRLTACGQDDPAGFVIPGAVAVLFSLAAAAGAAVLEEIIRKAAGRKQDIS